MSSVLGCDTALGMENKNITDSQIIASSVLANNFAQNARWNARTGWCAGITNRNQYIQVTSCSIQVFLLLTSLMQCLTICGIVIEAVETDTSCKHLASFSLKSHDPLRWRFVHVSKRYVIVKS